MPIRRRSLPALLLLFSLSLLASAGPAWAQAAATTEAAQGTIAGVVRDAVSGDPIIEAGVEVFESHQKTRTDLDGKYSVEVAPGTYQVRMFAPLYQGIRLQKVVVQPGKITKADAALKPEGQAAVEVVEVVAQADKAAEAVQLIERKNSPVVSDNISAETIRKSPGSNAGDIVQRAPAVTVKDSKFIVVRGLNERYTSALLNGSRLPSTDPDRRVVPLDLFPADFLDSLSIIKTYTPDLPGDFSGGLADIRLKSYPDKFSLGLGLSTNFNTNTTFQDFSTYKGAGGADYFGLGGNYRSLPSIIPNSNVQGAPDAQAQAYGRSFRDIWTPHSMTAPPGFSANFSVGDSFGPLGVEMAGIYTTEYKARPDEIDRQFVVDPSGQPRVINDFTYNFSTFETRLGGVFTSSYKLSSDHRLTFRSLVDHVTSDEVAEGLATTTNQTGEPRTTTQLQYTEERLAFGQIVGEHHLPAFQLDWRTAFSQTTQDQPDTRIVTRELRGGDTIGSFSNDSCGGCRLFGNLEERLTDSAVDFTMPVNTGLPFTDLWSDLPAKLKFGPAYSYRDRDYRLRRFQYLVHKNELTPPDFLFQPTEVLLAPENIRSADGFSFVEESQPRDSFSATQEIVAGYGMLDMPLFSGWQREGGGRLEHQVRLIAGVRTEYSYISLKTTDDRGNPATPKKNDLDPLPGVNLVYSPRNDMNIRFGYSQAVSRPEFRELSPVLFVKARGLTPTVGNPDLVESNITSYDARWEWFLSPLEVVSFSLFYKQLDKPIEQTVQQFASSPVYGFTNADNGTLQGFEVEARKNLGFLSPRLAGVNFQTNVSYVDSEVNIPRGPLDVQTSTKRALQGQSPFSVNAVLEYSSPDLGTARLLYNTAGERIEAAGSNGLPDIFEQRRDELDLVLLRQINPFGTPLNAKLAVENLLDDRYLFTQGDQVQRQYTTGVKISLGLSYSY